MSMDKKLTAAVYAAVEKAYDHQCDIEDAADEILEIIESDRQRRGEPVACFKCGHAKHGGECVNVAPQSANPDYKQLFEQMCERYNALDAKLAEYSEREPVGYIMPTAIKQLKAGGNAIVGGVSQGFDVPLYAAPQPVEPSKDDEGDALTVAYMNGYYEGKKAAQTEPVKVNAIFETENGEVIGTTGAKVKRVEWQDDGSLTVVIDYWPQPAETCASLISDKSVCGSENGNCDSQPAEPVEVPRPHEFNTGNEKLDTLLDDTYYLVEDGGMGNAIKWHESLKEFLASIEPVKVPSEDERAAQGLPPYNPSHPTEEEWTRSFPTGTEYSVEPHGNGYAIYQGRDQFHHGLNLAHLTECTPEFSKRIESALNAMHEPEGWRLVPKELIDFLDAKEHHLPVEDRHVLSIMLEAAPKFGEEE